MRQGGDDLDDDFVPDELVALSDGDEPADDVQGSLSVDEEAVDDVEGELESNNKPVKEKKRKRREKEKERKAKKRKLAESLDTVEPASITAQSPAALQSYLSAKQARTFSTMSALELGDMQIPDSGVNSGYYEMDWATNARSTGGLYSQGSSHPSHTAISEIQVQGRTDTFICDWSGAASRGRDQSSQRQEVTW